MFSFKSRCIALILLSSFALPLIAQDIPSFQNLSPSLFLSINFSSDLNEDFVHLAASPALVNTDGTYYTNRDHSFIPDKPIDETPLQLVIRPPTPPTSIGPGLAEILLYSFGGTAFLVGSIGAIVFAASGNPVPLPFWICMGGGGGLAIFGMVFSILR